MKRRKPGALTLSALVLLTAVAALAAATTASSRPSAAPVNSVEPTISGVALVGNTLTAHRGSWTGKQPINFGYAWGRCDQNGGSCSQIAGAADSTYTLTSSDVGSTIRVRVIAKNSDGKTTADSNATGVVSTQGGTPANSAPPTISGSALVGSALSASTGTWVGTAPITYSYKWLRCDSAGNACTNPPPSQASYTVVKGDVGHTLRVKVIAQNSRGKSSAISNQTDVVQDTGGGGGGGGGVIVLPGGEKSVPASEIPKGERLIVDQVKFTPNPVTSRSEQIQIRVKVVDTRGYVVRGAYVYIRSTPILTSAMPDAATATDGWVTFVTVPRSDFPLKTGYNVQFYVKAYRKGDPTLAGIAGTRLVQVATQTP